jgi:hypothetical protein
MILVLGVWAFVRALLVNSAAVSLENIAVRHQLPVLQRQSAAPGPPPGPALVASALTAVGRLAKQPPHRPACDSPCLAPRRDAAVQALARR